MSQFLMSFPNIDNLKKLRNDRFVLIAGPCVIEDADIPLQIAERLAELCEDLDVPLIYKASYRKANRSRADSFRGIGDENAIQVLSKIKEKYKLPILTDIHTEAEAVWAAEMVDVLQIPAFLCRQSSLLEVAGGTGRCINIKKGQFLSPEAMEFTVEKVRAAGNEKVMITERGTTFGYQDLIVDFRGIPTMRSFAPVILDCTHALQRPNQSTGVTGGDPSMIETLAAAGIAAGADGLFIETHPHPAMALSDGANMLPLDQMRSLLEKTLAIREAVAH